MATFQTRGSTTRAIIRRKGAYRSATFRTKTAAKEWARKIEAQFDAESVHDITPPGKNTVAGIIAAYEVEVGREKHIGRSKQFSLRCLKQHLGNFRLRDLTTQRLIEFINERRKEGANGVTIGIDISYLGTVFKWARAVKRIDTPIESVIDARAAMEYMGIQTRSQERNRRPTETELENLFSYWDNKTRLQIPMVDIVCFSIATGFRISETCKIQWNDLDTEKRLVLVRNRKDPRKKERNEWVPLLAATGYDAWEIILRQPRNRPRIFPYNAKSASSAFTRACKALEIDDLRLHDMRHEATSRLFEAGLLIQQVSLVTGHKDWRQLKRYTNLRPEDLHNGN